VRDEQGSFVDVIGEARPASEIEVVLSDGVTVKVPRA
jgi:hypothetical protein